MKKILSLVALVASMVSLTAHAQSTSKIISSTDSNDYIHHYYYNSDNQLFAETFGTTSRQFFYNENGKCTKMIQSGWKQSEGNYADTQIERYEYDADGNLSKKTVDKTVNNTFGAVWTYEYSDYVNGVATYYDEYKNGTLYYMYKQVPVFDTNNNLTECTVYYADPDKYTNPTHATVEYGSKDYTYTKTYDENGVLTAENDGKTSYQYVYADVNPSYVPANLRADNNNGKVTLTWDAVEGAESYIVIYDLERMTVDATNFTTTVGIGKRPMGVQPVINGVERNAAMTVVTVSDPGMKPITDLAVGEITKTVEETESEELTTRTFYNIPLSWSIPEGCSEIVKFNVYYYSMTYGNTYYAVTEPKATSCVLRIDPFEVAEQNEEGELKKGVETPIYITVFYKSGESEKSNTVIVNPFKDLGDEAAGIDNITADETSDAMYNLAGQRVNNAKGIVIKNNKKYFVK